MFDAYAINGEALLVIRPKGILGIRTAEKLMDLVELKEEEFETGFNRFCDLRRVEGIQLSTAQVQQLADRRQAFNPNDIHVKSAFLATDALSFGIARMYEQLLNSSRIEVRVWGKLQEAADWLGVKTDRLTL